jgi:RNA polymerase sigma-70 factor (ECF subfamily)
VDSTTQPRVPAVDDTGDDELRDLVARALAGEQQAAGDLYTRFHPTVLALHLAHTRGDRQLAHDLTQDTFVKVLYRLDRFEWRGQASLRAWISTIARNTFRDHVRAAPQRHHGGYDVPDTADPDDTADPQAAAERDVDSTQQEAGRVLDTLKPEHRLVLTRMLGEGAPAADVARELGRSEAAIHQLKRRALEAARRSVEQQPAMRGAS